MTGKQSWSLLNKQLRMAELRMAEVIFEMEVNNEKCRDTLPDAFAYFSSLGPLSKSGPKVWKGCICFFFSSCTFWSCWVSSIHATDRKFCRNRNSNLGPPSWDIWPLYHRRYINICIGTNRGSHTIRTFWKNLRNWITLQLFKGYLLLVVSCKEVYW